MLCVVMEKTGGPEVLSLKEKAPPKIQRSDEILVRLHAAGVNPVDTKLRKRGTYFPDDMPAVLGCDGAGIVEDVGSDVTRFRKGDAVYFCYGGIGKAGTGTYAQYAVVPEYVAAKKPTSLSFAEAAAAPLVLITAWESLFDRARLSPGMRVLVHAGAGGVGHVAVQLAKIHGACVATTVSTEEKETLARRLGADHIIRYTETDVSASVREWTDGRGADVVFDTVGGDTCKASVECTAFYGDLVSILQFPPDMDLKEARLRNLRLSQELMLTPQIYEMKEALAHQGWILSQCTEWFDEGKLRIHLADRLPLTEAQTAHRRIEGGHMMGKIALEIP